MSLLDDTHTTDRIEAYLLGELSPAEREAFELEMKDNPELLDAVEEMKALQEELVALEREQFVDQLNQIRTELEEGEVQQTDQDTSSPTDPPPSVRKMPRWYFAAAAGLLLLIIPMYLLLKPSDSLFEQYFTPYEDLYSNRGSAEEEIKLALKDYNDGQFKTSLPHFDAYLEQVPSDSEAVFYAGIAHLGAGQSQEASQLLETVTANGFLYQIQAKWYLALSYLESDMSDQAKTILKELANSTNSYQNKAAELLKKLE